MKGKRKSLVTSFGINLTNLLNGSYILLFALYFGPTSRGMQDLVGLNLGCCVRRKPPTLGIIALPPVNAIFLLELSIHGTHPGLSGLDSLILGCSFLGVKQHT